MHHLILGYGYCGYYLAKKLLGEGERVTAVSRQLNPELLLPQLVHLPQDIKQPLNWPEENTIVYYLIPPLPQDEKDNLLKQFLAKSSIKAKKVIYFGSSGVYGNHQGAWVTEESPCLLDSARQLRRLDAEQQWLNYCSQHHMQAILLRTAGIYGPSRLPVDAAKTQMPVIETAMAPWINHIYVGDLVAIAYSLAQLEDAKTVYNIADGNPQPMGTMQQLTAKYLGVSLAPYETWQQAWERASPMKKEFMNGSKRLSIERLKSSLQSKLTLTDLNTAIKLSLNA